MRAEHRPGVDVRHAAALRWPVGRAGVTGRIGIACGSRIWFSGRLAGRVAGCVAVGWRVGIARAVSVGPVISVAHCIHVHHTGPIANPDADRLAGLLVRVRTPSIGRSAGPSATP